MPPKPRTVKKSPALSSQVSSIQNTRTGLDPEAEDRFELELCWCIQQIENCLSENMQQKQVETAMKTLNVLKSKNASIIKKRQFMRNVFGDYRQKMADDEKKFGETSGFLKFTPIKKAARKSVFLKKANKGATSNTNGKLNQLSETNEKSERKTILDLSNDGHPFKFNFPQSETK